MIFKLKDVFTFAIADKASKYMNQEGYMANNLPNLVESIYKKRTRTLVQIDYDLAKRVANGDITVDESYKLVDYDSEIDQVFVSGSYSRFRLFIPVCKIKPPN